MQMLHPSLRRTRSPASRQSGLTLIELMVSIVIGMIVVAALATLIADQSGNRAEVDRAGRLIENGRYAIRTLAEDLQMAGYWGELTTAPAAAATYKTPCGATPSAPTRDEMVELLGRHATGFERRGDGRAGYNADAAIENLDAAGLDDLLACLPNLKAGTDLIVVRRADPDSTPYEDADGATDTAKLAEVNPSNNATRLFIQTGLNAATNVFSWKVATGANHATLDLVRKDKSKATVRKLVVRIYYVTTCSVCSGPNADTIPSLKMKELIQGPAWSDAITIAEGIENVQIEYGLDTSGTPDGAADGDDVAATSVAVADWGAAVTAKLYVLARNIEVAPGYTDTKTYPLGLAGTVVPTAAEQRYKRHVFVQTVRFVNPSFRRSL